MSTVEEDAAHIDAVTARLVGIPSVYVLILDGESGIKVSGYVSDALARQAWCSALKTNWPDHEGLTEALEEINVDGVHHIEFPNAIWWTLELCEVATK